MVGIEATPNLRALALTGQIGIADAAMSAKRLRVNVD